MKKYVIPVTLVILVLILALFSLWWLRVERAPEPLKVPRLGRRAEIGNGLILLVAERSTLPMVTIEVLVKAGSLREPTEKPGLANLTAELLPLGTTSRTAPEISEAIEFVGGGLSASGSRDFASVSLTVLKRDLDLGLELLADVLMHPAFREEEIARRVEELQGSIRRKQEDPGTVAQEAFASTLFGDHPYGRPVEGTEESLARITRKDLVEFHQRYYVPNNSILAAAGDVTLEEMQRALEKHLRGWQPQVVPPLEVSAVSPPASREVVKIDRQVTQANIVWGHLGVERNNPDYYALSVMNLILGGGGLTSRLMRSIREERGWAYDVHSFFSARRFPGAFEVSLQTKNETAGPAIEEVFDQIRSIRENGITAQELEEAKGFLTGSFPLRFETNRQVVSFLAAVEFYGLGMDYPEHYPEIIRGVTPEGVLRVARKYLYPDRGILVLLADPTEAKLPF